MIMTDLFQHLSTRCPAMLCYAVVEACSMDWLTDQIIAVVMNLCRLRVCAAFWKKWKDSSMMNEILGEQRLALNRKIWRVWIWGKARQEPTVTPVHFFLVWHQNEVWTVWTKSLVATFAAWNPQGWSRDGALPFNPSHTVASFGYRHLPRSSVKGEGIESQTKKKFSSWFGCRIPEYSGLTRRCCSTRGRVPLLLRPLRAMIQSCVSGMWGSTYQAGYQRCECQPTVPS